MYDYQAAKNANIDFVFLSKWTEVNNWENKFLNDSYSDLSELVK